MTEDRPNLEDLRLGRSWVAHEQDVDVATVPRPSPTSPLRNTFVGAAEHLEEDALLDVVHLVDRRRQATREQLVRIRSITNAAQLLFQLACRVRCARALTERTSGAR